MPAAIHKDTGDLGSKMLSFTRGIDQHDTPAEVLDRLHDVAWTACRLSVLGALLFPLRWGDVNALERDKTVFLHRSEPEGWWVEWLELTGQYPAGLGLTQAALAPFTTSEVTRLLQPLGVERLPVELAHKYGMRDQLICPVGGRWVLSYWSRHDLSNRLSPEARAFLILGATFAAIRLETLVGKPAGRIGKPARLTPRELAVLRLLSLGRQIKEAAGALQLGEETVRSHLKKAEARLGVHNRAHAVAQALRLRLIP